jgi:hypothetical protein
MRVAHGFVLTLAAAVFLAPADAVGQVGEVRPAHLVPRPWSR